MTMFFTADTHFGHAAILKYTNRPFKRIEDHDRRIINAWNTVVSSGDTVYHLGDFGFGSAAFLRDTCRLLHGKIILLRGNHDLMPKGTKCIDKGPYLELVIPDAEMDINQTLILFHYPLAAWNKEYFGSWHLHGHQHGRPVVPNNPHRLDVGVDAHDFCPISYERVKEIFTRRALYGVEK